MRGVSVCASSNLHDTVRGSIELIVSRTHAVAVKLGRYDLRRRVAEPREGFTLPNVTMTTVAPIPYDVLKEGIVT